MDESQQSFSSREQRIVSNEVLCRELNERKALWMRRGLPTAGFRCECEDLNCGSRLPLSLSDWDEAHLRSNRFVVAPGHVARDVGVVVEKYSDFWLVEKQGEARLQGEPLKRITSP